MLKKKILLTTLVASLLTSTALFASTQTHEGESHLKLSHKEKAHTAKTHTSHWGYEDTKGWGALNPKYSDCSTGKRQSPIDIETHNTTEALTFKDIFVSYKDTKLDIINNGHSIQVNSDKASKAILNGKEFKLLQFHFHSLSEHTINSKYSDMEVHSITIWVHLQLHHVHK